MGKGVERSETELVADICVVGGAGHVGLPLSMVLASKGKRVLIYDLNESVMNSVRQGVMPFFEKQSEPLLKKVLDEKSLLFTSNPADLVNVPIIIVTIGTPVDEFLNPTLRMMTKCLESLSPYLRNNPLMIMRSTVYPGVTEWVDRYFKAKGIKVEVAFCPERVVQGCAIEELQVFPQLVSGMTPEAEEGAAKVFQLIATEVVRMKPIEAEFAKLFSNSYRYIQFAVANQFYMITQSAGVDYYKVLEGLKKDYPRARDIPRAGLAGGPCLLKDTMQLAAFFGNQFGLGHMAMMVNEGLPLYIAENMLPQTGLDNLTIGLLGMAFKANNDDIRSSLSYKLKKTLAFRAKNVLTTDPYVKNDPELQPLETVLQKSDVLILCAPHDVYLNIDIAGKQVIDIWNFWPKRIPS